MSKQIILRPVYNRPEMLYLSLEYEKKAREYHSFNSDLHTIFIVEHGSPKETISLLDTYSFSKEFIFREKKYGLSANILEGMKVAFSKTNDFVIYIEDDVLVHETYFQYMDVLLSMGLGKWSVLSPFSFDDKGDVNKVRRHNHYAALAPLINKEFFMKYVVKFANKSYYNNRHSIISALTAKYAGQPGFKYKNAMHNEQAGLHNRLVDIAAIEEDRYMVMPEVNRQQHIGYFGKNRPGGIIPGDTFNERLSNLRNIIEDANKMYELSATKQYNDYKIFSPKLNTWNGKLRFE